MSCAIFACVVSIFLITLNFIFKTIFTKGKKRKKPDKDLNAPKAPLTGYVRFLNEHREKVRAENHDLPFHEVTKILGNMWSQLPSQQKQV